ncbi:MAG: Multiple RNA-binding domain-containing protein 1 [Trizodia sp. TS-e1964]|nr:MAG: Multiple RNA-binding domain-containing protein 1 [Trizodia sp. TS-e1964]
MESSRIFIRGLPPTMNDQEFKAHFAKIHAVTDAKLIPQRRIGYVGYKSPQEAHSAVKYFNKSFIRMSRIAVEIARPITAVKPFQNSSPLIYTEPISTLLPENTPHSNIANPLKRKREKSSNTDDSKLLEFLEVMRNSAVSKKKELDNNNAPLHDRLDRDAASELPESDSEYMVIPKRPKAKDNVSEAIKTDENTEISFNNPVESLNTDTVVIREQNTALSDADWVRSRTSRILGLSEVEEVMAPLKVPMAQNITSQAIQSPIEQSGQDPKELVDIGEKFTPQEISTKDSQLELIMATSRLFVRNLSYSSTEDDLRACFSSFGELQEVYLPTDSRTGAKKGFAYIEFIEPDPAVAAFKELDGKIFQGRLLHILPSARKRGSKLDEFAISKLPLKKQNELKRKAEAASFRFNWNSMYMNIDAVINSVSERLGIAKSDLMDPASSDSAVKQAHAETHVIQETKAYFSANGVNLDSFRTKDRSDTVILVKNFSYGTNLNEIKKMFEEYGFVKRALMPPAGTIAIVELEQAGQARAAFTSLAYRRVKDSILFLEKAPKDLFTSDIVPTDHNPTDSKEVNIPKKAHDSAMLTAQSIPESNDTSTLFVRNLNFSTTAAGFTSAFKPLEGFLSARIKTKPNPHKPGESLSMGFGFLEFRTRTQALAALAAMNGFNLDGHQLLIKVSQKDLEAADGHRSADKALKALGRTKIIIKNLPFEASKKDVKQLLTRYGSLRSVRLPKKIDNSGRGFAFAEFLTSREALNAIESLRDTHLLGRRLILDFAEDEAIDAEEQIEKMQNKIKGQVNKMALQNLTGVGRRRFNVEGNDQLDGAE